MRISTSLLRTLNELKRMEILDDHFHIAKPDYYLVFNGDLIGESPFLLETLTLLLE